MQGQNYIEAQEILDATNGGLDIILYLYPQAAGSELNRNQKFKVREEKSPSASLKKADDGNWLVTDFGGDQKPRNAIQCYMLENNMGYSETLQVLAAKYSVAGKDGNAPMIKAAFSKAPAGPDEQEGTWSYVIRKNFTDTDIETIISKKVIAYLEAEDARARMNFTGRWLSPKKTTKLYRGMMPFIQRSVLRLKNTGGTHWKAIRSSRTGKSWPTARQISIRSS